MAKTYTGESSTPPNDLDAILDRSSLALQDLGAGFRADANFLADLKHRLTAGRFHLAVLGQFKRGKSTLLNALLGERALPTSVVPLTSVPTFLYPGLTRHGRVVHKDDRSGEQVTVNSAPELAAWLSRFVTEEGNPDNRLNVSRVEVFHPSPLLRQGVVLIDTPGIGSTFRHNTEATLDFLSQCDAALFVLSPDPPITEVEAQFLDRVRRQVNGIYFILNKVDSLVESEREAAVNFIRSVLRKRADPSNPSSLLCVSARSALHARESGDPKGWQDSGMEELRQHITEGLAAKKNDLLLEAVRTKSVGIIAEVENRIELAIRASQMPLAELESRLETLGEIVNVAERDRSIVRDLLKVEEKRIIHRLYQRDDSIRSRVLTELRPKLETAVAAMAHPTESAVRDVLAAALPELFEEELSLLAPKVECEVNEALRHYSERAEGIVEALRKGAAQAFYLDHRPLPTMEDFRPSKRAYWKTYQWDSSIGPVPAAFIDHLMPLRFRRSRIRSRSLRLADSLVVRNIGRMRSRLQETVQLTFAQFGTKFEQRLRDTISASRGLVQEIIERRRVDAQAVTSEVDRLRSAAVELAGLRQNLERMGRAMTPFER